MLKEIKEGEILRKRPYTYGELFELIWKKVEDKLQLGDYVDYALSSMRKEHEEITELGIFGCTLAPGGSEGTYLDITYGDERIGCVKTLHDKTEDLVKMGNIFGVFVEQADIFMKEQSLNFEWDYGNTTDEYSLVRIYRDGSDKPTLGRYFYDNKEALKYANDKVNEGYKVIFHDLKERRSYNVESDVA